MPVGDLPGWRQVFADDFTQDLPLGTFPRNVSDRWTAYPYRWPDSSHHGAYNPALGLSEHDGVLDIYLHYDAACSCFVVEAPEPKIPGAQGGEGGLLYGRYAVRFKADPAYGYKTAWLLWPDSERWPTDGEIDFPEGNLSETVCAFMHYEGATTGDERDAYCTGATYLGWHTAVIEWLPGSVTFYLDGQQIGHSTQHVPHKPMHWVLQSETSTMDQYPPNQTGGHIYVDWVTVYSPA